jgi:hypothetical protein
VIARIVRVKKGIRNILNIRIVISKSHLPLEFELRGLDLRRFLS